MPELPTLRKDYSLIIHAIHSRMQQIRSRMNFEQNMTVNDFREANKKNIENIRDSIQISHNYKVNTSEEYDAAVIFLHSIDWEGEKIKTQPDWKPKR